MSRFDLGTIDSILHAAESPSDPTQVVAGADYEAAVKEIEEAARALRNQVSWAAQNPWQGEGSLREGWWDRFDRPDYEAMVKDADKIVNDAQYLRKKLDGFPRPKEFNQPRWVHDIGESFRAERVGPAKIHSMLTDPEATGLDVWQVADTRAYAIHREHMVRFAGELRELAVQYADEADQIAGALAAFYHAIFNLVSHVGLQLRSATPAMAATVKPKKFAPEATDARAFLKKATDAVTTLSTPTQAYKSAMDGAVNLMGHRSSLAVPERPAIPR